MWNLKLIKNGIIINSYQCNDFNLLCSIVDYFINVDNKYDYEIKRVNKNV